MALSRSAVCTVRQRHWLWALTGCGGVAGLIVVEGQLQESAREHGQTATEYAEERAKEVANGLKKTTAVAGALLRSAMSSALVALEQRNFDPGSLRADIATTVADLASETSTRRHLLALGGGYFLDWLLQLAYPQLTVGGSSRKGGSGSSNLNGSGFPAGGGRDDVAAAYGTRTGTNGSREGFEVVLPPVAGTAAGPNGSYSAGAPSWPPSRSEDLAEVSNDGMGPLSAAALPVGLRLRREAERALESILKDDVAAGLLFDRPGAVPVLLRAVAEGMASSGVAEVLMARAAEARVAAEAMTADLLEVLDMLRGSSGSHSSLPGGEQALQCTAAGLLSAWAAGNSANRAKLTGLGLPGVLAELATAASGSSDRAAVGLQWQLLRLTRVMAEHSSCSDSHHLAACVLPLLYTAADAAAAEDACMASYAIDTLSAAVRNGGAPVAEVVANSSMPHLLWQLAEGLGAHWVPTVAATALLDGKEASTGTASAAVPNAGDSAEGKRAAADAPLAAAAKAKAKPSRSWLWSRGGSSSAGQTTAPPAAPAAGPAAGAAGGAAGVAASSAVKSRKVMQIQDWTVAASVAAAVADLARSALLPEAQVPRWRDWLLDVLCADGFDPGICAANGAGTGIGTGNLMTLKTSPGGGGSPAAAEMRQRQEGGKLELATAAGSCSSSGSDGPREQQQQSPPPWLTLPESVRQAPPMASVARSSSNAAPAPGREVHQGPEAIDRQVAWGALRSTFVSALSALSHMPGNHGLQAAHYWLSRLLSELAARTLPYTSLVYLEGPRAPQDLIHAVPVSPSYVKSVADALERAADAVADDSPALPPHLEFDLAGSGIVGRPTHDAEPRRLAGNGNSSSSSSSSSATGGNRQGAAAVNGTRSDTSGGGSDQQNQQPQRRTQRELDVAAYRQAAHVVDVVVAERKAADALEALCAIVAPDLEKQRWLLQRGVLPLLHRLTRTSDDPRVILQEQGQPGAESLEQEVALEAAAAIPAAIADTTPTTQNTSLSYHTQHSTIPHPRRAGLNPPQQGQHQKEQQQQEKQEIHHQQPNPQTPAVVSEILSDHEGGPSLCLQRQVARMLALLALLPDAQGGLGTYGTAAEATATVVVGGGCGGDGWLQWLRRAASSSDCRLSSNATRTLLHLATLNANAAAGISTASGEPDGGSRRALKGSMASHVAAAPIFLDGIHLLDPGAQHHWALVRQAAAVVATAAATEDEEATVAAVTMQPKSGYDGAEGDVRPEGPGQLTDSEARGAAIAVTMAPAMVKQAVAFAHDSTSATAGVGGAGGAAVVTMGCGAAGGGGSALAAPSDAHSMPSAVSLLLGTLRYVYSMQWWLWGTMTHSKSHGGGGDVTSITARSLPGPATTAAAGAPRMAAATQPESAASPSSAAQRLVTTESPAAGTGNGGSLNPSTAIPLYPMPYSDVVGPYAKCDADGPGSGPVPMAAEINASAGADTPPSVDVVFVHGIRGGPFITWRKAGVMTRGAAASHMERSACWPSTWLAEDVPGARLLSVEYLAPVSAWEGESLPLEDNVSRVMGQLAAAGVGTGERPVVFVAHSMGGLLVKEMLARSMDQAAEGGPHAALAPSTRGIVFFGTPHFGNGIAAMGWKLRHVPGALPAPSLARLTPGPHLLSLNDRLRELHDAQGGTLRVVSMLEGQPTQLSGVLPRILIVAPDSAYPGFGAAMTLPDNDHIDCCKPAGRAAPAYVVVRDLVLHAICMTAPGGG